MAEFLTLEEKIALVEEYLSLPHGTKGAWLERQGVQFTAACLQRQSLQ